jgi:hypothetical protein
MRLRIAAIFVVVPLIAAGIVFVPKAYHRLNDTSPKAAAAAVRAANESIQMAVQEAAPPRLMAPGPITVNTSGFWSWALLDRRKNEIDGSPNMSATNTTESMIKVWIVSDFLRRTAEQKKKPTATQLKQASTAILDSNDDSAQSLWVAGGGKAVIPRLISICKLTDTKGDSASRWSLTQMSARDAVRMGECVADGRAAGPEWTSWVLEQMRNVRGTVKQQQLKSGGGRWGIIEGLPVEVQPTVSIKNGWTAHTGSWIGDNMWHLNCLGIIGDEFVLAVEARFPVALGLAYGAGLCKSVTEQLVQNAQDT